MTDRDNYWTRTVNGRFGRRKLLRGGAMGAAGLAAIAAVGCGDDDDDDAPSNGTQPTTATGNTPAAGSSPTAAGSPAATKPEGEIKVGFSAGAALQLWNPVMWVSGHQTLYRDHIADCLVGIEPDGANFKYSPFLAESWEKSDDGLTNTFKLRKDAKFHDGSPVTAEDIKFTYEFLKTEPARHARKAEWTSILDRVDTPDENTAVVRTTAPYPLLYTFNVMFPVLSKAAFEKGGMDAFENHPIAAGPFSFVNGSKSERVVMQAVEGHYRKTPAIRDMTISIVVEEATRVAQLQTGELDLAPIASASRATVETVDSLRIARAEANVPLWLVVMDPFVGNTSSPLNDPRVREALSLAVNRQAIVDNLFDGEAVLKGSYSTQFVPGYAELPADPYDLTKAKQLLEAAGHGAGFEFDYHATGPVAEYVNVMVADWAKVGLKANLQIKDALGIQNMVNGHMTPGVYAQGTGANYIDPGQWGLFTFSDGAWSYQNSPELDALMFKVNTGSEPSGRVLSDEERAEAWGEVQRAVYEDRVNQVLWHQNTLAGVNKRVKNWEFTPGIGYFIGLEQAQL